MSLKTYTPAIALLSCAGVFVFDQYSKTLFFEQGRTFYFFSGWVQWVHHQNYGIAFNIPIPQSIILGVTLLACIAILVILIRKQPVTSLRLYACLGILLGGALGNAFDRWHFGFVRDWLLLWHRSAINMADLGVIFGLLGIFFLYQRDQRTKNTTLPT